ncbi:MAG: hypothetical protein ACFFG0_09840 [Candidatus Thorarchaeota archaeon]
MIGVSFYDASDDSLIDIDFGIPSGDTASIPWLGLAKGATYSWYVIVSDGISVTTSITWSFTVLIENPNWVEIATDQVLEYGDSFIYDLNATDLSGIHSYWINDTSHFSIDAYGLLTNNTALAVGIYWIEVRA